MRGRLVNVLGSLTLVAASVVATAAPSSAAPPPNDSFADATVIDGLPYVSDPVDLSQATVEDVDYYCSARESSVWYSFVADTTGMVVIEAQPENGSAALVIYADLGGPSPLYTGDCGQPSLRVPVQAGQRYFVSLEPREGAGVTTLSVRYPEPPPNDDWADAHTVTVDEPAQGTLTAATLEPGEPTCFGPAATVWYAFTAPASRTYAVYTSHHDIGVYRGGALAELTQAPCTSGGPDVIRATAGQTYWIAVEGWAWSGDFELTVRAAPDLQVFLGLRTGNVLGPTPMSAAVYDPVGLPVVGWSWTFGDGGSSALENPSHQYTKDGVYPVTVTVTSEDGRQAATTAEMRVVTHDIAIASVDVPREVRSGDRVPVTVRIASTRYPETATVTVHRLTAGGTMSVGSKTDEVRPLRPGQSKELRFSYTATKEDARVGKLVFMAEARLHVTGSDEDDVLPLDNTGRSTLVVVRPRT